MPTKANVEITAIYNELEEEISSAMCGDNVRVRLRGVEDEDISPGFVLTSPKNPVHAVRHFEAQLAILEHKNIICAGYSAIMHVHTLSEEITLPVRSPPSSIHSLQSYIAYRLCYITLTKQPDASLRSRLSSLKRVTAVVCSPCRHIDCIVQVKRLWLSSRHPSQFVSRGLSTILNLDALLCETKVWTGTLLSSSSSLTFIPGRTVAIGKVNTMVVGCSID